MNTLCLLFTVLNLPAAVSGHKTNVDFTVDFDEDEGGMMAPGSGMGSGMWMAPGSGMGSGMWMDESEAPEFAGLDLGNSHDFNPIARGLRWEHDRPVFDSKDILDLQVYLLEEKIRLLGWKCIKHDFIFGYKGDDLKKLELSILRLKIALLKNPHAFSSRISISIKVLEELLELVKAVEELKFKLKLCPIELIHLKYDNHGFPVFKYEQLEKLQLALLKVKVALLKNPHDIKYVAYTKEYLFKLKLAVLKLEIFLYKNPLFFQHKFIAKDLLDLIIEIIDIKNGFPTRRFSTIGGRIQHGLRWEHDEPRFDSDDILSLTLAVLKEKAELKKFDCIKHGFKFNYKDDDLQKIKLSLLKLKVALLKNPHAFSPKLLLKIKFVEDLLKYVEELIAIKFKLKACVLKLIQLKFDHDFPLFKVVDLETVKIALLKLKVALLDGFLSHEFNLWTLKYLKGLEVAALKLKIALLKNPLLFGHHINFDEDDFLKLVKEVIVLKEHFKEPSHPTIGHLEDSDDDMPEISGLSIRPVEDKIDLEWNHNGYPLFTFKTLVAFKEDAVFFKRELQQIWRDLQKDIGGVRALSIFKYNIEELVELRKRLLRLKVLLFRDSHIFKVHRHSAQRTIDVLVDVIEEIVDLLKKILAPAPTKPPTKKFTGNGKCSNDFDQIVKTWNLRVITVEGAKKCWHGKDDCVSKYVRERSHVSESCSTCFGDFKRCAAKQCWITCLFKSQSDCQQCADENCSDDFEECAFGSWKPNWKQDMGYGWRWGNHLGGRRRTPFEGMDFTN